MRLREVRTTSGDPPPRLSGVRTIANNRTQRSHIASPYRMVGCEGRRMVIR